MDKGLLGFSRFLLLALILLGFCSGNGLAQTVSDMVRLEGNISPALKQAAYVGHHDPTSTLDITVALRLRNTDQLQQFLQAVRDPASSVYHQFLTPEQFNSMYGPTQAQVSAVVAYLNAQGLAVTDVTPDNRLIHLQAQSGKVEQVFHVLINDYAYHGRSVFGTMDNPKLPSDIASAIVAVRGLSNILQLRPLAIRGPSAQPLASGGPTGFSPQQIATAYNWPSITDTTDGSGVTIAIAAFNSAGLKASDYDSFWSYYGLPSHTVQIISVDSPSTGYEFEPTLDVERSGAMAPGATIDVYDGECPTNPIQTPCYFDDVYQKIASANSAQVMTTSFGAPIDDWSTGDLRDGDQWFEQMAAQGIAVFAADGDGGSSDCRHAPCTPTANMVDYPSADPYVVAAGGTSLTLNGNNTIASETVWSYSCNGSACGGTGGAISNYVVNGVTYWPEPSWQTGNGVPQNGYRNTSDISMDADPNTGYSLYFEGGWEPFLYGGTSFVAPQLAGLFADQISLSGGTRLGQANEAIYVDANSDYTTDFHDITSGSNGAYSAGPGWDHPTGWGSPNAAELLTHIAGGTAISEPQNLNAEYLGCRLSLDKYFITWQAPQIGTPSGGYDAEYEYVGQTNWQSFHYGPGPQANINLPPSTAVGIRVRASNGSIWSAYNTDMFTTSVCSALAVRQICMLVRWKLATCVGLTAVLLMTADAGLVANPVFSAGNPQNVKIVTFNNPDGVAGDGDMFGYSVALSGDASTVLIGAFAASESGIGAVGKAYIFTSTNGTWSASPSATFIDPGLQPLDKFGNYVALSTDGSTALIGGGNMIAYVYEKVNGAWSGTPSAVLNDPDPSDGGPYGDCFGCALALSADGSMALIGASGASINGVSGVGRVYVFTRNNGIWVSTPAATLSDPGTVKGDDFGSTVALSADGSIALIGTNHLFSAGRAFIYYAEWWFLEYSARCNL